MGAAAITLDWAEVASAAHAAHAAAQSPATATYTLLGAADAADIEALTSQIIPSDDAPGAREAGVSYFIDRALGSFFSTWRPAFQAGLADFQAACHAAHPDAASFAALASAQQIEFLRTVDGTVQARLLTLCGMFSMPKCGGNHVTAAAGRCSAEDQRVRAALRLLRPRLPGFTPAPEKRS
jgi:hypothetical protein